MGQLLVTGFRVFSPLKRSGFLMSFVPHLPLPNKRRAGPLKSCSVSLQPHSKQGLLCKEKLLDQRILTGESRHTFGQRAFQKQQLSAKSHLDKKKILPFLVNLTLLISSNTGVSFQARGRRLFSCLLYRTSASFSLLLCCHIAAVLWSWAPAAGCGLEGSGELSLLGRNETSLCPLCQLGLMLFPREGAPFIWLTITRTTKAGLFFQSLQTWVWDSLEKLL